jgi:DNA-binding response OmpR family regulator
MQTNDAPYVLIADDDPLMLKTVGIILRNAGFRVVAVTDGQAALDQMKKEKPALALLDVMMGCINGLDLVRMIRADADLEDLTVFLLTARAMPHEKQQGYSAGANDYITKPFSNRDLVARVTAVLQRHGDGTHAGTPTTSPGNVGSSEPTN